MRNTLPVTYAFVATGKIHFTSKKRFDLVQSRLLHIQIRNHK